MEAQLRELLPFLRDRNPQVRQIALSNLLPQTPKNSPYRSIFFQNTGGGLKPKENDVIRDLKLLCRDQISVAHDAFRALVNLSDSPLLVASLSEASFLTFIVAYIINPQSILADLASMLLSNLTAASVACSAIVSLKVSVIPEPTFPNKFYPTESRCGTCAAPVPYPAAEARSIPALPLLLDAFVQGAQIESSGDLSKRIRKGELHFLASVFANITASPAGREFFLSPRPVDMLIPEGEVEYALAKMVSFTEHENLIRRGGVTSTIKNCAFHVPGHRALLSPEHENVRVPPSTVEAPGIDILPYILLPLAGPEEFDLDDQERLPPALQFLPPTKKREQDTILRLTHVETLLLLCHTRWGREYQRANGVYEIVRAAHEVETVDKISEHIERLVNLLKGDEPAAKPGTDYENDGFMDATVAGTRAIAAPPPQVDSDDEDSKIEEV